MAHLYSGCSALAVVSLLAAGCVEQGVAPDESFTFAVLNVGQGLSQVGVRDEHAVVWDMGPNASYDRWRAGYELAGSPRLNAIVISHCDEDHWGGLRRLDTALAFSGLMIVSHHADTSLLRAANRYWGPRLRFRCVAAGETCEVLDDVRVECLWPPRELAFDSVPTAYERNEYSLVFRVTYGSDQVLVTSDIDTSAQRRLCADHGRGLDADLLIAAHHGSCASVDRTFYGSVAPAVCIVSCAAHNDYGHPCPKLLDMLWEMDVRLMQTATQGHILARSTGSYWTLEQSGLDP